MKTVWDSPHAIRYISHRGFTPLAPENSIAGFEYAGLLSQWAIETDVRMTRDGKLVCCHDADVSRMFGADGLVAEMTWADLAGLRFCQGNRLDCLEDDRCRMPLFSEYLAVCKRYACVPFIEAKIPDVKHVLQAVKAAGFEAGGVVMSSVTKEWLLETRKHAKDMFVHWIFAREAELEDFASLGNAGVSLNMPDAFSCTKDTIEAIHGMGLKICLRAGDSVQTVTHMRELGLDYIPTNCMHLRRADA